MADMTDSAFCQVVKEVTDNQRFELEASSQRVATSRCPAGRAVAASATSDSEGASQTGPAATKKRSNELIVFREMVSAEAVVRGNNKTLEMTAINDAERPLVQQLFGSDPVSMANAAKMIEAEHHPEGFGINMGCPVYKIVHNFNGAALMQNMELASNIVRAVKAAITVPLSVKIRLGWSNPNDCVAFAQALEAAGADLITVHGRTKVQGYGGVADWRQVGEVKKAVSIPVLVNGDIHTAEKVVEALAQSNADGVLIARGALGNPWIFSQINEVLAGLPITQVTISERLRVVRRHLDLHLEQYGESSVPTFRKHLSWYFKGQPHMKDYKQSMMTASTKVELTAILDAFLAAHNTTKTII